MNFFESLVDILKIEKNYLKFIPFEEGWTYLKTRLIFGK